MKTEAARAAMAIRAKLKALNLKARVKSRSFSMGNAVDIYVENLPPFLVEKVRAIADFHQYGHFDGMTDCYEYSNNLKDVPQAKYVHVNNELTDAMREKVYQWLRSTWVNGETLPATYEQGRDIRFHDVYISQLVWQEFCRKDGGFWQEKAA